MIVAVRKFEWKKSKKRRKKNSINLVIIVRQRLDKIRSIGLNCANLSFRSEKAISECEKLAKKAKKKFYDQKITKIRNS